MRAIGYLIGAGSMSLGVEGAGFNLEEIWETPGYGKNAQTWDLNRPEKKVRILELDHNHPHFSDRQGLDLIYGNPPCGGLSSMTGSHLSSPTNNCMRQWIRMVVQGQPRMILMENAYQLATERAAPLLRDLTDVLDEHGYWWWTWLFYSFQIGTPQIRRRMFLCASKDQPVNHKLLGIGDLPDRQAREVCPCGPWLWDLVGVAPSPDPVVTQTGATVAQHWYTKGEWYRDEYNPLIQANKEWIGKRFCTTRDLEKAKARLAAGEGSQAEIDKLTSIHWEDCPKAFGSKMFSYRPQMVDWNMPAPAIIGDFKFVHPIDYRVLTMREMARLMGYPDSWQFHTLRPHLIAQGIPVNSAFWAADRMLKVVGLR